MPNVEASESPRDSPQEASPAVEHAFERFLEPVFHYVSRRVAGREEAEDTTAEVFTVLAQSRPRLPGEAALYLWLLGIARRKIADALRRRQRRPETPASQLSSPGRRGDPTGPEGCARLDEAAGAGKSPEECLLRSERRRVVRELMDGLHPDQREALLLKYVEGLSMAEVASAMNRSPAAVNSLLQRARAVLFRRGQGYFLNTEVDND